MLISFANKKLEKEMAWRTRMIEPIQSTFKPNYAVPPGETLKETLDTLGMTQNELVERVGRPHQTINGVVSGKLSINADTALQLERALGVPASFWNNLETNYQQTLARLRQVEQLKIAGRVHRSWHGRG